MATDSQLACTTNPQTHTAIYCTRHPTQHSSRTSSFTRNSLDYEVFVATTRTSLRKQRKCASPSRHVVIPIQLSTTANTVHSESIRNRHHTKLEGRIPLTLTFHPHNISVKNIILKISSYFSTIPPLPRFYRNHSSFHTNGTKLVSKTS